MDKNLTVWLDNAKLGTLSQDKSGRMSFAYDPASKTAISLSMPLREQPYDSVQCEAFFGGLLPESENARQLIGKRFGVNGNNSFSLLSVIGHECAGAVSLFPEGQEPPPVVPSAEATILNDDELARHITELPKRPLLAGVEGIRLSLAGAGDKAAVLVLDGKVALPADGMPTTHILKPSIGTVGDTVSNEFFCMRLAARLGLTVADVEMRTAKDLSYLLVKRYDRRIGKNGDLVRIHQEDFCQALGVVSAQKYQNEGGPGYKDCFDLLKHVRRPALDRNRLQLYVLFNFVIGNMDAHAKNFSVIHQPDLTLAPMYDVLSTVIYPELSKNLAMKVDKYYGNDEIFPRHWKRMCDACGIAYPGFKKSFTDMCTKIVGVAEELRDELRATHNTDVFNDILQVITNRAQRVLTRFAKEPVK